VERRKVAPILLVLISLLLISSFLAQPSSSPLVRSSSFDVKPQADLAPPTSWAGVGYPMGMTESVDGSVSGAAKANDTLTSNQWRNATFPAPAPTGYSKAWQNLTVTGLTAAPDVRTIQYGTIYDKFVTLTSVTSTQIPLPLSQAAQRFTVPDVVNLTAIWIYYSSTIGWNNPVQILSQTLDLTTPVAGTYTVVGSGSAQGSGGLAGWYKVVLAKSITLNPTKYYWVVANGTSIPTADTFECGLKFNDGSNPNYDASGMLLGGSQWLDETDLATTQGWTNHTFSFMLMLDVLPVNPSNVEQVRTYSSPAQVGMVLNGTAPIGSNRTTIPVSYNTIVLSANTSITFTATWNARFHDYQATAVSTHYIAKNGYTLWNASFPDAGEPSNPYTWSNLTFEVTSIPQFWSEASPPVNVTNMNSYALSFLYGVAAGSGYYLITQTSVASWSANTWLIATRSTYGVSLALPKTVVAGLPFSYSVSTGPYLPCEANISFYNSLGDIDPSGFLLVSISSSPLVMVHTISVSQTYTFFVFNWWDDGNEVSFNKTLTINVVPPLCNVTANGRTSPVIGNTGSLTFKFYNNSLGTGNTWMQPQSVSVNDTPVAPANLAYNAASGNTTVYMNTASAGWRAGNITLEVSAESGVFNATEQTWIMVQRPLCNVTFVSRNLPFLGGTAVVSFKFFNRTVGASPVPVDPTTVEINGTAVSPTYSGGVVTATWNTASDGWFVGAEHVNVTAVQGIFANWTIVPLTITEPFCNVTVTYINQPILGKPATAQFEFLNGTNGWVPVSPISVMINGTDTPFAYSGGVTSVTWSTLSGGWLAGSHHVGITAVSGVFTNTTVCVFIIIPPNSVLQLNETSYTATYGDSVPIGFKFLNETGGGTPFPTAPALYVNGSSVVFPPTLASGMYTYTLDTRQYFSEWGTYSLNFTCILGTYSATNITLFTVNRLIMNITLRLDENSVTSGSDLAAHATLTYPNGTFVEDYTWVTFQFTVTFVNGTVRAFNSTAQTLGGTCSASFPTTSQMKQIMVEAIYLGGAVETPASQASQLIPVTLPVNGLPVWVLPAGFGVGVLLVVGVVAAVYRRRHRIQAEDRKTAALRQTASLAQLLVVHLASGRCLFSRTIGSEEGADPNLISGFLSANQTLINEVFKKQTGAGLRFADYGEYKVISDVGKYVMATLFATETAGEELKETLRKFTQDFEKRYGKTLPTWDGDMKAFEGADEIADDVFCLPLTAPYMLLEPEGIRLSKEERAAVHSAKIISAERGVFFMPRVIDYLLTKQGIKRAKAMDTIDSLTKKGIFRQLTMEQAAEVIKSCSEKKDTES
jgi:hypothetical protein